MAQHDATRCNDNKTVWHGAQTKNTFFKYAHLNCQYSMLSTPSSASISAIASSRRRLATL
jgi:hypothetical protein